MNWNRRYAIKSYLLSTIWTTPVVALVFEQAIFRLTSIENLDFGWIPGFALDREGVIAGADYIIGSTIAFLVFAFSSLLVAIQVASGQLTPRIIATTLLRDSGIRWSVAVFVYALASAVAVKSRVGAIPHSFVSLTGIVGLSSVVVFLFLIDHAARLLRPVSIVRQIAEQGLKVFDDVYPDPLRASSVPMQTVEKLGPPERTVPHRGSSGIVIAINLRALVAEAKRADVVIEVAPRMGDFIARDDPLFLVWGRGAMEIDERKLCGRVAFGSERTIEQDSTFAIRVIVDIAIKALSPAINDPTTAVLAIDQLQRLLRSAGNRNLHNEMLFDSDSRPRVIFQTPDWDDFVNLAFNEIRQYGASSIQVVRRLRAMIENLSQSLPGARVPALRQQLDLLDRTAQKSFPFPEDLALVQIADSQGLGGASGLRR